MVVVAVVKVLVVEGSVVVVSTGVVLLAKSLTSVKVTLPVVDSPVVALGVDVTSGPSTQ